MKKKIVKKKSVRKKAVKKSVRKKVVKKKVVKKKPVRKKPVRKTVRKKIVKKKVVKKKPVRKTVRKKIVKKKVVKKKVVKKKPVKKKTVRKTVRKKAVKKTVRKRAPRKRAVRNKSIDLAQIKLASDYRPAYRDSYMCLQHLAYFHRRLLEWKEALMRGVDQTVDHMKQDANSYADANDRASHEEGFDLELRTRDRERKLIRKINKALARISSNQYGYCEECSAKIGLKRIEARPTATLCIDCKTVQEIQEKQIADD